MKIRPEDWEETIAQLIHERSHRAGTGQVCDKCRAQASGVAVGPGPALRRRLGRLEQPAAKMYRALFFSIRDSEAGDLQVQ